jgi:hypothetical protein
MRLLPHRPAIRWALALGSCVAIVLLWGADLAAQCQMCRTALTQSAEGQRWSRGINAGILFLLAAPFLIAGSILLSMYHAQLLHALRRIRNRLVPGGAYGQSALVVPPLKTAGQRSTGHTAEPAHEASGQ